MHPQARVSEVLEYFPAASKDANQRQWQQAQLDDELGRPMGQGGGRIDETTGEQSNAFLVECAGGIRSTVLMICGIDSSNK